MWKYIGWKRFDPVRVHDQRYADNRLIPITFAYDPLSPARLGVVPESSPPIPSHFDPKYLHRPGAAATLCLVCWTGLMRRWLEVVLIAVHQRQVGVPRC